MSLIFETETIIEQGGVNFNGPIPALPGLSEDLANSGYVDISGPINAQFEISVGSKELLLLGNVSGEFRLKCSRCTEEFTQDFKQDIEETYPLADETIDVGEQFRQAMVLVLPEKPLCRSDCRGICLICGVNKNLKSCVCQGKTSSPFAKLKDIFKEKDK